MLSAGSDRGGWDAELGLGVAMNGVVGSRVGGCTRQVPNSMCVGRYRRYLLVKEFEGRVSLRLEWERIFTFQRAV